MKFSFFVLLGSVCAEMVIEDLTHDFDNKTTLYWPGSSRFELYLRGTKDPYYESNIFCAPEHGGTHMDAPSHFVKGKQNVHQVPLTKLISKNIFVVDVSKETLTNRDLLISKGQIEASENVNGNGQLTEGAMVFLYTGLSSHWNHPLIYFGGNPTNASTFHFPGLANDAATWLANQKKIISIGIDTPSIDYGQSTAFVSHKILFAKDIPVFENVDLSKILSLKSKKDLTIMALPMKINQGSGAPLRIVAMYETGFSSPTSASCKMYPMLSFVLMLIVSIKLL